MSRAELDAWQALRTLKAEGVHPTRQHKIGRYTVDFAIRKLRIAIEVDGGVHNLPGRREADAERQKHLENVGWRFIRVSHRLTRNPDAFLDYIRARLPLPLRGGGRGSGEAPNNQTHTLNQTLAESSAQKTNVSASPGPLTPSPKGQNLGKGERRTRAHRKLPPRRAET